MPSRAKIHRRLPTLGDIIRERLEDDGRAWSPAWQGSVASFARRCDRVLGGIPLDQLTVADAERLRSSWPHGSTGWNRARSCLLTTWRRAQRRQVIPLDMVCPFEAVPNYRERRVQWAAPDGHHLELDRAVVEAIERGAIPLVLGRALRLLAYTARRPSEIAGLPASAVRLDLGLLHLSRTKIGETQTVPLQGLALDLAAEALEEAEDRGSRWLFPQRTNPHKTTIALLQYAWQRVLDVAEELGIETTRSDGRRFLVRDFRPLGITAMARAGVQPNIIARVVGHKSTRTTERYLRLSDADARKGQLALFTTMQTSTRTKEEVLATIAGNIKRLRAAKGWSQVRCADALGVTRQYWYQLEQDGKADVTVLLGVGRIFGVTLEELTGAEVKAS